MRAAASISALFLLSCYAVDVGECRIRCADVTQACPEGSACAADGYCHASAEEALCSGMSMGDGAVDASSDGLADGAPGGDTLAGDGPMTIDGAPGDTFVPTCDFNGECNCTSEVCPGCPDCEEAGSCIC